MARRVSLVLLGLAAIVLSAACGGSAPAAPTATPAATAASGFPRVVADSSGTELRLAAAPQRIISLSPGLTEVLYAIGAGDRVVATDRFSDYPAEAARTPKLEYSAPSAEAALAHRPDLVIMTGRQKAEVPQFRAAGMPVLYIEEARSVAGVMDHVTLFGGLTGREREAHALVTSMRQRMDAVTAKLGGVTQGPRVFFELSPDLYTAAPDSFIGGMLTLLKAQNAAQAATTAFPQLSAEAVIAFNPQVVLLSDAESAKQSLETVAARPGWSAVAAVQQRRVHPLNSDHVNRPGPRIVDGFEAMARMLYPEQFR